LAEHQQNLAAMMSFVRNEIGQHVPDVEWQVPPYIILGRRDPATVTAPQLQQRSQAATAALERGNELPPRDEPVIHSCGRDDPEVVAEGSDPIASRVVQVGANSPDRSSRNARDGRGPVHRWNVFNQRLGDTTVGIPGGQDGVPD
jgi:hypothetical protein